MKLITEKDLIPLSGLDILKIKAAPKNKEINNNIGILSKMAVYDKNIDDFILESIKDIDYFGENK
jgi:hypothetical protein